MKIIELKQGPDRDDNTTPYLVLRGNLDQAEPYSTTVVGLQQVTTAATIEQIVARAKIANAFDNVYPNAIFRILGEIELEGFLVIANRSEQGVLNAARKSFPELFPN